MKVLPRIPDQEGHLRGGDGLRGYDEVAFILAVLVVQNDDEFAIFWDAPLANYFRILFSKLLDGLAERLALTKCGNGIFDRVELVNGFCRRGHFVPQLSRWGLTGREDCRIKEDVRRENNTISPRYEIVPLPSITG